MPSLVLLTDDAAQDLEEIHDYIARHDSISRAKYDLVRIENDQQGQVELDNFIDPESDYPVLVTTSRLLSTGVDVQTCRLIVLDREVGSGREFAAWLGLVPRHRGTAGRVLLMGISKRGDTSLRTLLIHGARSVLIGSKAPPE